MNKRTLSSVILTLLLGACGGSPEREQSAVESEPVPEITLNLPQTDCKCTEEERDYTFLEKGFNALEAGEYLESLQYFQRYQRIENSPTADVEARIAIAYLSILPDSPIFDREAARESYTRLRPSVDDELDLHGEILLMQASLETFIDMQQQIDRLRLSNKNLQEELQKREAAIKRLRDLTLGRRPEPAGLLGN